jgi:hypothetical protein
VIDSTDFKVYQIIRRAPSKGFVCVLAPDAPYGPEVVLDLRGEIDESVPTPDAQVVTEHEGESNELSFMKLVRESVTVLLDLETASAICDALRFHEMSQREEAK